MYRRLDGAHIVATLDLVQRLERPPALQSGVDRSQKHHGHPEEDEVLDSL